MGSEWIETPYGQFSADFCVDRLSNLCDANQGIQTGPFGSQLHQEDYVQIGTPIITVEHLGENRILHANTPKVSDDDRNRLSRYQLNKGDIVFSRVGSVDRRALVREKEEGWLFSGRCLRVRPDPKKIDSQFLSYFFGLPAFKEHIRAIAVGATMPSLNTSLLSEIAVPHPSNIDEQRAIAHILGTLDDKIELNRQQNETLEAVARALFKAWFVDFEPVRAKIEGRARQDGARSGQPRTPQASDLPWPGAEAGAGAQGWQRGQSLPGLPAHLYDLFPDRLVESELGEIPEGWEMRSLDSIANYLNGLALQKFPPESEDEFLPVIKIAQLRAGNTNGADRASARIKPEYVVVDGDVLFSWSGSLEVEVWNGGRGALNQHLFKVTSDTVPKWFYFFATRQHLSDFRAIAAGKATTMGHIQCKHLTDARIAVAPPESMKQFDAVIASLFDQFVSNAQQSRTLAQLRDTLLPKLISGELRVADTEQFTKRAEQQAASHTRSAS
jgi:type I restriction enzyme S subunit